MTDNRFYYLFEQYFSKTSSNAEIEEFMRYIDSGNFDRKLEELIDAQYKKFKPSKSPFSPQLEDKILKAVMNIQVQPTPSKVLKWKTLLPKIAVAASIAFCIGTGIYFYHNYRYDQEQKLAASLIEPGKLTARLILANGRVVNLDTLKNGTQSLEAGIRITKTADGQLVYELTGAEMNKGNLFNTIETPRGGHYQLRLPDGSKVWLNSASSLKYTNNFNDKKREVTLIGEAYFEIVHRKDQAFSVYTSDQHIEVLGTHFNVNAYPDEAMQLTTLLEGKVKTIYKSRAIMLAPGQQAILDKGKDQFTNVQADTEVAMAWKNGDFVFKNEDLEHLMRRVARWYDIEVTFAPDVDPSSIKLGGYVSRSKNIQAIITIIRSITDLELKIEGRRIIVSK